MSEAEGALTARILEERALQAALAPEDGEITPTAEGLLVRVRTEQYAVEMQSLSEVEPNTGVTPVPCTPPYVTGIINVRGEILTVLDLAVLLGFTPQEDDETRAGRLLLVRLPTIRVALQVDDILGDFRIELDKIDRSLSGNEFAKGIIDAKIVFLDLEALLSKGNFELLEEVS